MRLLPSVLVVAALGAAFASASPANAADAAVSAQPDGSLIVKDGEKTVASFLPKTEKLRRGTVSARTFTASGHELVEVRIPVLGDAPKHEEVWVAQRSIGGAKVVWWNFAGARDVDGETALVVKVSDRGVEEYQTAARVSRCDGVPVPLFPRTWDFASHSFRAALPDLPARSATVLQARRGDAPEGKPLGGFFFTAASASSGAVGDAARLKPPAAINDGDPTTVWTTEGNGRGQILTARSSGGFPITGLRLLPGDTSNAKSYRSSAKPRKLTLIFGRDPSQNIEVELTEDADGGTHRLHVPYWIALPKPVASTCVTVLIREATSSKDPMSIAELDVLTELDGPGAADKLVADLSHGVSCEARQPQLVRLGPSALARVATAISSTGPGAGRECLVEALDALVAAGAPPSAEAAMALVAAMDHATAGEDKVILKLLPGMASVQVEGITALLLDDKRADSDRIRAARVLAAMGQAEAHTRLLGAVGRGSSSLRKSLREIVWGLKGPALAASLAALEATPSAESGRRADLLLVVGALAAREPNVVPAALSALRAPLHGTASFEEQARAIEGLGMLRDPAAVDELIDIRTHNNDGVLRSLAANQLVGADGAPALAALRTALDDADPRVREAAAAGLGHKNDKPSAKAILAGAKQEPWPQVRRAEIAALGELCTAEGNELLTRAFQRDVSEVRQAALLGLAHCYQAKATGLLLRTLGRLAESPDMRSLAARLLGERKDPKTVHGLAEALARLLVESQADLSLEAVVADSAMALASIRGEEAIAALVSLLSDSRPSVERIAVESLGVVCDPGPGSAALKKAATSKDEAVSIPAAAALASCRERH